MSFHTFLEGGIQWSSQGELCDYLCGFKILFSFLVFGMPANCMCPIVLKRNLTYSGGIPLPKGGGVGES